VTHRFHLTQLLNSPNVAVSHVVEPWFLGIGQGKPGCEAFEELRTAHKDVNFCASVLDVSDASGTAPRLFLIAGRTCDAPRLFLEALSRGATHVYIEKPGGESAAQLCSMRDAAAERGVEVIVGYNKNVAEYTRNAVAALQSRQASGLTPPRVVLEHCNEFEPGEPLLSFLRGPGAEGMLHNMCCHELALACTRFGVTCDRITSIVLDRAASELVDLGEGRSDWQRVSFVLKLAPASEAAAASGSVSVDEVGLSADRCGGNYSRIVLKAVDAEESFQLPSPEHLKWILKAQAADPDIRPYFLQQAPDYEQLKTMFVEHILAGLPGIPEGVVGLEGAIEALQLADLLVPALKRCWAVDEPWLPQRTAA